jgi:hypothetical protein
MTTLHKLQFSEINFYPEYDLIEHKWYPNSSEMSEDEFKKEMLVLADVFKQKKPKRVFVNHADFEFIVVPQVQKWVDEHVNWLLVQAGTQKVAFLVSPDIFTRLSVEQTLSEVRSQNLQTKFFEDYQKAMDWLLEE